MQKNIGDVYKNMDLTCDTYPSDTTINPTAYLDAIQTYQPGDVAIIFTPDDTHYDIALTCIQRGMHVMVTKPIVQTLEQHIHLIEAAKQQNVLVAMEVHKRWDPFYADARDRARSLEGIARPIRVTGTSSTGIAASKGMKTEDSITLTVQWENLNDQSLGCAVYTSSWVAPKSDVHSQQRFLYMGTNGEITVDQAHRGMTLACDGKPFASVNPLFMKYTPTNGMFSGQASYGVKSFECFIDACLAVNAGTRAVEDFDDGSLATARTTVQGTAILEAGRRSLDADGRPMDIVYGDDGHTPVDIRPHEF